MWLCFHGNIVDAGGRLGNWLPMELQPLNVEFHGFGHQRPQLLFGSRGSHAAGKVGGVCAATVWVVFNHNWVAFHYRRPAFLSLARRVPGRSSPLSLPAIVSTFGLAACFI